MKIEDVKQIEGWEDYMEAMYGKEIRALPEIGTEMQIGGPENKAELTGIQVLKNGSGIDVSFKQGDVEAAAGLTKIYKAIQDSVITW